jgi:hypothetical protein
LEFQNAPAIAARYFSKQLKKTKVLISAFPLLRLTANCMENGVELKTVLKRTSARSGRKPNQLLNSKRRSKLMTILRCLEVVLTRMILE